MQSHVSLTLVTLFGSQLFLEAKDNIKNPFTHLSVEQLATQPSPRNKHTLPGAGRK